MACIAPRSKQHGAGVLLGGDSRSAWRAAHFIAALVEQRAQQLGAVTRAFDGSGNTDIPEGLPVRRIVDAFRRVRTAHDPSTHQGRPCPKRSRHERISRDPPYGWRLSRDGTHIERQPREQAAVHLAQKLRRSGLSLRRIAHRLTKRGYTPRSAKRWHPQTISSITKRSWGRSLKHSSG